MELDRIYSNYDVILDKETNNKLYELFQKRFEENHNSIFRPTLHLIENEE